MLKLKYTRIVLSAKQFKLLEEMKWIATAVFFSSCGHFPSLNGLLEQQVLSPEGRF